MKPESVHTPSGFDVAGVGAAALDYVCTLPTWPAPAGPAAKLPVLDYQMSPGGQTATAMAACAAFGLRAAFAGVLGADSDGRRMREALETRGVDVTHAHVEGKQAYSIILLTTGSSERVVLWRAASARPGPPPLLDARLIHVDDTDEDAAVSAARTARDAGRLVTTDIDRVTARTRELMAVATHPILAEHVPGALTGESDLVTALRHLRSLTAAPLIVTRGALGALALEGDDLIDVPGIAVDAIDTTGAGDVFRAGFITALLEGRGLPDCLRFANAAAAASCEQSGAMGGIPDRARVEALAR